MKNNEKSLKPEFESLDNAFGDGLYLKKNVSLFLPKSRGKTREKLLVQKPMCLVAKLDYISDINKNNM